MVMGVPYKRSVQMPAMNTGNPVASFAQGMAAGQQIRGVFEQRQAKVEERRAQRRIQRILSGLSDDEMPTQEQFMEISRYMGADMGDLLLKFHNNTRQWKREDRLNALQDFGMATDILGTVSDRLSEIPPEMRGQEFMSMMDQMMQHGTEMNEVLRPTAIFYRDGQFGDERIERGRAVAFVGSLYNPVIESRLHVRDYTGQQGDKTGRTQTKEESLISQAARLAKEHGGSQESYISMLMGQIPDPDPATGDIIMPSGNPYDIGTYGQARGLDNSGLYQTGMQPLNAGQGQGMIDMQGASASLPRPRSGQAPPRGGASDFLGTGPASDQRPGVFDRLGGVVGGVYNRLVGDGDANQARKRLINSIMQTESAGDPNAVSPKGAVGLMQIMPETARDPGYGVETVFEIADRMQIPYEDQSDQTVMRLLRNPRLSLDLGTQYLEAMLGQYNGDLDRALVAYNFGPGKADDWDGNRSSLPKETRMYLDRITRKLMGR